MSSSLRVAILAPSPAPTAGCGQSANAHLASSLQQRLPGLGVESTVFQADCDRAYLPAGKSPQQSEQAQASEFSELEKVAECFERSAEFDVIHNLLGPMALTFSRFTQTPVLTSVDREYASWPAHDPRRHRFAVPATAYRSGALSSSSVVPFACETGGLAFSGLSEGYLLWCGEIGRGGASATAVEVANRLRRRVVIVGPTADAAYFAEFVSPQLAGFVDYLPEVPANVWSSLLGGAAALLLFGTDTVSFPAHAVEAMTCGTPVAAVQNDVTSKLVDQQTGVLCADDAGIADAVRGSVRLNREGVRENATQRFSAAAMVQAYVDLYGSMAGTSRVKEKGADGSYKVKKTPALAAIQR